MIKGEKMNDTTSSIGFFAFWGIITVSEIYGLYLAITEGAFSFAVALVIPPWAIIKGFFGLLMMIF